jgi:hypothetical protein
MKSSEAAGFAAANVQDYRVPKQWRSTGDSDEWVGFDFGSNVLPYLFCIFDHNVSALNLLLKIESSLDSGFAALEGTKVIPYNTKNLLVWGQDTDPVWIPARYWRVRIQDSSNPDGYIRFGRVVFLLLSSFTTLTDNINPNWNIEDIDPSLIAQSESQSAYHKLKTKYEKFTGIHWNETMTDTTKDELKTIWDTVGKTEEIVALLDPSENFNEATIYGRLSNFSKQKKRKDRWSGGIQAITQAF